MQQKQIIFQQEDLKPNFSNQVNASLNSNEFTLDFYYDNPNSPITLIKRIAMSPGGAKGLVKLMEDLIRGYEKQHGKVEAIEQKSKIGFDTEDKASV